jgi:hypothetical protein
MHNQGQGEIASEKHRNMTFLKTEDYLTINACTKLQYEAQQNLCDATILIINDK